MLASCRAATAQLYINIPEYMEFSGHTWILGTRVRQMRGKCTQVHRYIPLFHTRGPLSWSMWGLLRLTQIIGNVSTTNCSLHQSSTEQKIMRYCRRTNFHILWVKFSRGQIFVGGGSPWKFNHHKKLFTSSTRDRNDAAWGRCRVSKDTLWQGD